MIFIEVCYWLILQTSFPRNLQVLISVEITSLLMLPTPKDARGVSFEGVKTPVRD